MTMLTYFNYYFSCGDGVKCTEKCEILHSLILQHSKCRIKVYLLLFKKMKTKAYDLSEAHDVSSKTIWIQKDYLI